MAPTIVALSTFFGISRGQRIGHPPARAGELFFTAFGQLLASFPELQGGVQIESALLELADHLDEFVPGLFVPQFTNGLHLIPHFAW